MAAAAAISSSERNRGEAKISGNVLDVSALKEIARDSLVLALNSVRDSRRARHAQHL